MIVCWCVNLVVKKIDLKKPLDLMLCDYIVNNKPNMEFPLMLNKIKERTFAPHLVFAQNFQLWGYGQYGMHGSIVNVPTNLNLIQNILPRLPYDDSSILFYFKIRI
jgi:hypothetical protein